MCILKRRSVLIARPCVQDAKKKEVAAKPKPKVEEAPLPPPTVLTGILANMFVAGGYLSNLKAKEQDWIFVSCCEF
jgi:hypothetical protein